MTDCWENEDSAISDGARELHGQAAIVTGSSSGIGRAVAIELARAGADVFVHAARNREGAEHVAAVIRDLGRQSRVHLADLACPAAQEALVDEAWNWAASLERPDDRSPPAVQIWINNAGVDVLTGAAANWSFEEKLARLWEVDVVATMRLSRMAGKRMRTAAGSGGEVGNWCILNMGWDQAQTGMGGESGEMFAAVKGAVMGFTKSLAHTLAPTVRVNCLAPGWIKTSWGDVASEYWVRRATQEALLARWGTPADVARVARFLVSPAAAFLTGQVVPVNGGFRGSMSEPR